MPAGRRSSDAHQSKGLGAGGMTKSARRRMSSAKGNNSFMNNAMIEEEEEEEEEDGPRSRAASDVQSRRASKRKSQLRQSYVGPVIEITDEDAPEIPSVDDALMNRIQAIEDALNRRGIGAVDFAVQDDALANALGEEDEELEETVSNGSSSVTDEKKHADAQSMV